MSLREWCERLYPGHRVNRELDDLERRLAEAARLCIWKVNDQTDWTYWEAGCDHAYSFEDGDPISNEYQFCPGCGHPILTTATMHDIDTEDNPTLVAPAEGGTP